MRATRIPIGVFVALLALPSCDGTTALEPPPPDEPPAPGVLVLAAVTPVSANP
jgi:hypothetical protein